MTVMSYKLCCYNVCLLSVVNSCYNSTWAAIVAELAEIDALPCAEIEMAVGNWDGDADPKQGAFGMGWHIV